MLTAILYMVAGMEMVGLLQQNTIDNVWIIDCSIITHCRMYTDS
jgi:hypothetical protein